MKLRYALIKSKWNSFQNNQKEKWNVTDLLNEILDGQSPEWLDKECYITNDSIIDCHNEELIKIN